MPVGSQDRQSIQQQISGMRRLRRRARHTYGLGDLAHFAAHRQTADGQRRADRVPVGLAREPRMQRFEAPGGLEQQQRRVAAAAGIGRQLSAQQVCPRVPELVERPSLRHGQQPQRRVRRAGLVPGPGRCQRPAGPAGWLGGQLGGPFEEGRRRRQTAAGPGPAD
jgi:hypothetical protein